MVLTHTSCDKLHADTWATSGLISHMEGLEEGDLFGDPGFDLLLGRKRNSDWRKTYKIAQDKQAIVSSVLIFDSTKSLKVIP